MTIATLEQVELLAGNLSPLDQLRLIQRLVPKIATSLATAQPQLLHQPANSIESAWQHFFAIGDAIAAGDREDLPTLTQTLELMRR